MALKSPIVLHFSNSMWFLELKRICVGFFYCLYMYYRWRSYYQEGEELWSNFWFYPAIFFYLSQAMARFPLVNVMVSFVFNVKCDLMWNVDVGRIANYHWLNFISFHNLQLEAKFILQKGVKCTVFNEKQG